MIYIEKNDKPNFLEKQFNLIKVQNNTIYLPISKIENKDQERKIEKLAEKTNKIINKISISKKIVLSKEMKKENTYLNYLNTYGYEISDGKWLSDILLTNIVEYVVTKNNIEKASISILINDLTEIQYQNINILAQKYSEINIVTNHIEKFRKLEEKLIEDGIAITITNNKRKSLLKSKIVVNVDFPNDVFNKYRLNEDSIIISIKMPLKINQKRFNGKLITNYEIKYNCEICDEKYFCGNYYLKDLYESQIYKRRTFKDLQNRIKNDKVRICTTWS